MIPARNLIGLAVLTLMWGINWPVMKLSLRELSPLYFRAITMSGGLLLLICWYRSRRVSLSLPMSALPQVVVLAVPNILGWHALSIFGVQALASGRAAIVGFTMPIWVVIIGVLFFREKMTPRLWMATACSAGAVVLLLWHELDALTGRPVGVLWMLSAAFCWALGTLLLKRVSVPLSTEALTVWMIGLIVPVVWVLAVSLEPVPSLDFSPTMWVVLVYGFAINYGIAQILWFSIARSVPPVASGLSIMFIPVIGLGSAMVLTGEQPFVEDYFAAALIVVALATTLLIGRRSKP
ncbi:DMT family transporter [Denitromonas ohlonensis]|uniref:DMT family transporter n=2 Tax=Denitromonas TaxID=139331 RepID=A0A557SGL1_9RHOO|nr:DMT family transporter [Denitromonas ohlonensis]TVO67675.1 DMT family transporter [Denitromonas ohlonensis]TVO76533.1 DMT family transporter [Denitromonas ohlonensis]